VNFTYSAANLRFFFGISKFSADFLYLQQKIGLFPQKQRPILIPKHGHDGSEQNNKGVMPKASPSLEF
jgi:hypothetical protein